MPRRRTLNVDNQYYALRPTPDRFADDTSMIGFRYLHKRYKTWFRVLWVFLLIGFVGITAYQVVDRIHHYIAHPLNVNIVHETVAGIPLPKVLLCNKMQVKASAIAERDPHLLTALSQLYINEHQIDNDTFVRMWLNNVTHGGTEYAKHIPTLVDAAALSRLAQPKETDFIVGCFFRGSQECRVEPVATPSGICYAVSPQGDPDITRPGPENSITILLDVETHEVIPGFNDNPGIKVFLQPESAMPSFNSDGLHLSPGQTITIPVNDIHVLERDGTTCGTAMLQHFRNEIYRQSACYWEMAFANIATVCQCEPARSPLTRDFFRTRPIDADPDDEDAETKFKRSVKEQVNNHHYCNIVQEFTCVRPSLEHIVLPRDMIEEKCPNECKETSYGTIMLGSPLDLGEISAHLPSNWDEMKEDKLKAYQRAYKAIPKERVRHVQAIQQLAADLQDFLQNVTDMFSITDSRQALPKTCSTRMDGYNLLGQALTRIQTYEPFWRFISIFSERVIPTEFESVIRILRSRVYLHKIENPYEKVNRTDTYEEAVAVLTNFTASVLTIPTSVEGLSQMAVKHQNTTLTYLSASLTDTLSCLQDIAIDSDSGDQIEEKLRRCREIFDNNMENFMTVEHLYEAIETNGLAGDFEVTVNDVSHAIKAARWTDAVFLAQMKIFSAELQDFAQQHRKGGVEDKKLQDLFNVRLACRRTILERLDDVTTKLNSMLHKRAEILELMPMSPVNTTATSEIREVLDCLHEVREKAKELRKHIFLRDEWVSRLSRVVKMTLAQTPGAEYDEVNLLFVKVYFAQLKKETVIQRQSFNLFVLLAEIGGTVGLYLGATVVTVLEIFVFFIEDYVRIKRPQPDRPDSTLSAVSANQNHHQLHNTANREPDHDPGKPTTRSTFESNFSYSMPSAKTNRDLNGTARGSTLNGSKRSDEVHLNGQAR